MAHPTATTTFRTAKLRRVAFRVITTGGVANYHDETGQYHHARVRSGTVLYSRSFAAVPGTGWDVLDNPVVTPPSGAIDDYPSLSVGSDNTLHCAFQRTGTTDSTDGVYHMLSYDGGESWQ